MLDDKKPHLSSMQRRATISLLKAQQTYSGVENSQCLMGGRPLVIDCSLMPGTMTPVLNFFSNTSSRAYQK